MNDFREVRVLFVLSLGWFYRLFFRGNIFNRKIRGLWDRLGGIYDF